MKWNWQQKDWPNFRYNATRIEALEKQFLQESGVLRGAFTHINDGDKKQITIELISTEAIKTSEIEGEILSRNSVQSSIRRHFGLSTDHRKIPPAEQGIADMMLDLHDKFSKPLTHEIIFLWHEMLCNGRHDLEIIGGYRKHEDPMQVVSGPLHKPNIHFEAPPSKQMQQEMKGFIRWFNQTKEELPLLTRASIAHLYFVSIHPFEDGNGRMARALTEKSLAQALDYPTLISLSKIIERNKKNYYDALELTNKNNEITKWIEYFANTILEAQRETQKLIEFLIAKTKFFGRFQGQLNVRQEKVILRLFEAGPDGFEGGLSATNYQSIANAKSATTTRDLTNLVEKRALTKTGELKSTRYYLNI